MVRAGGGPHNRRPGWDQAPSPLPPRWPILTLKRPRLAAPCAPRRAARHRAGAAASLSTNCQPTAASPSPLQAAPQNLKSVFDAYCAFGGGAAGPLEGRTFSKVSES